MLSLPAAFNREQTVCERVQDEHTVMLLGKRPLLAARRSNLPRHAAVSNTAGMLAGCARTAGHILLPRGAGHLAARKVPASVRRQCCNLHPAGQLPQPSTHHCSGRQHSQTPVSYMGRAPCWFDCQLAPPPRVTCDCFVLTACAFGHRSCPASIQQDACNQTLTTRPKCVRLGVCVVPQPSGVASVGPWQEHAQGAGPARAAGSSAHRGQGV